jgi:hypothetical protein
MNESSSASPNKAASAMASIGSLSNRSEGPSCSIRTIVTPDNFATAAKSAAVRSSSSVDQSTVSLRSA